MMPRLPKNLLAFFLATRMRRVVALTVAIAIAIVFTAPPVRAQIGVPAVVAAATAVINLINNVIGGLLNAVQGTIGSINGVLTQFQSLWQEVVYPLQLINQARATVSSMIAEYRGLLTVLLRIDVTSAQLANPAALESTMRNRGTGDFAELANAYVQTYRAVPQPADAHPIERDLADIDDAMGMANLKTLKASDAVVDQMMAAANVIEDEGVNMAPGSAGFLAGADLLVAADCVPFAYPSFHADLLAGRAVVVGCPKLDDLPAYAEKLTAILGRPDGPVRVTVARMEVPCCAGITAAAQHAAARAGREVPVREVVVGVDGAVRG